MLVRTPNMQLRCGGVAEVVAFATGEHPSMAWRWEIEQAGLVCAFEEIDLG